MDFTSRGIEDVRPRVRKENAMKYGRACSE